MTNQELQNDISYLLYMQKTIGLTPIDNNRLVNLQAEQQRRANIGQMENVS